MFTEMKNSVHWGNSRSGTDERRIKKPDYRAIELAQNAAYKHRISKQKCREYKDMAQYMSITNSRRKKGESNIQYIMAKTFSKAIQDSNSVSK